MSSLTDMIPFLYERRIMRFAEQWTADSSIPAEELVQALDRLLSQTLDRVQESRPHRR